MASQLATVVGCYISHLLVIVACASGHASDSNVRNELEVDVELIDVPTTLTLAVQACRTIERNSPDVWVASGMRFRNTVQPHMDGLVTMYRPFFHGLLLAPVT